MWIRADPEHWFPPHVLLCMSLATSRSDIRRATIGYMTTSTVSDQKGLRYNTEETAIQGLCFVSGHRLLLLHLQILPLHKHNSSIFSHNFLETKAECSALNILRNFCEKKSEAKVRSI